MKFTLRLPTDQYAYIEQEVEADTAEDAVAAYRELKRAYEGGEGIPMKDFVAILHEYATTGGVVNGGDVYGDMSKEQQTLVHCLKKLLKTKNN